jgi:probable phosphoglycerate mutase
VIVLARHGVTDHNTQGRFLGRTDLSLNAEGRLQCAALAVQLGKYRFARCYSSPMRRCRETSAIIVPYLQPIVEPMLREIDFGQWEGHDRAWLEQHDADGLAQRARDPVHFRPEGGESFADVAVRLKPFTEKIKHETGDTLVVAHRGSLGVLERLMRELPLDSKEVVPLEPAQFHQVSLGGSAPLSA